ncbi:MAG: WS/DGAT/MGAT family O-acyltransferase [Myxococcota bacterium]
MAGYTYERLSAQDASFLWAEGTNEPMHVGAVAIFETEPLGTPEGGIDITQFRRAVESVLHWIPRYRQKLAWIPFEGWPIWVDDHQFELGYHIRHIALPHPGGPEQLKEMAARIHARPLDRQRPLWEMWVIEGVEGGEQFALLNKIHHCMIDGAAGADLSQILLSPSPRAEIGEPVPYMPRPAPTSVELLGDSVGRTLWRPVDAVRAGARAARAAEEGAPGLEARLGALRDLAGFALRPASATPINGELGPHRRLDWLTMPLDDVKELRRAAGCTINDIVLATVSAAVRRYMFRRRVDFKNLEFRVAAPVSTRKPGDEKLQGNHVSTWIVPLPLEVEDPLAQLRTVRERTESLKRSEASLAIDTVMQMAEWLPAPLLSLGVGLANGPANMIVTNVPGPQFPLYTVGSRLLGMYPLVPLLPGGGLGIALFSYEGRLCWGFNADPQRVPDLPAFVDDVRTAFEALRAAIVADFMARRTAAPESEHDTAPAVEPKGRAAKPARRTRSRPNGKRERAPEAPTA